jgi:ABC-2 type transport system permease protein
MSLAVSDPGLSWRRIRTIARRHSYVLRRSPHRLFDVTVWPLVDVLLFGAIGNFVAQGSGSGGAAFAYLVGGIILWHVVYQSQIAMSTGFLEETWSRNLLNLMVTPLKEVEYVAGVALFGMVKLAMGVGLTAIAAAALFAFNITSVGFDLLPIVALLLACGWLIGLFVIGIVLRFGSGAEAFAWGILFAVLPLSGVFYPVSALPGAVRPVALALPTTHAFAAMRGALDGRGLLWDEIGLSTVGTLALAAFALFYVTRMLQLFRKRGYISRYS